MRPVALARIAVQAEVIRLRAMASRIAVRVLLVVIALLFVIGAIVFAHIAAWLWLDRPALASAGILGGVDLGVAVIFAILATRSGPGAPEREAIAVRRQALEGIGGTITLLRLVARMLQVFERMRRRPRR
jgi:uncharacterized membrane protein